MFGTEQDDVHEIAFTITPTTPGDLCIQRLVVEICLGKTGGGGELKSELESLQSGRLRLILESC